LLSYTQFRDEGFVLLELDGEAGEVGAKRFDEVFESCTAISENLTKKRGLTRLLAYNVP